MRYQLLIFSGKPINCLQLIDISISILCILYNTKNAKIDTEYESPPQLNVRKNSPQKGF